MDIVLSKTSNEPIYQQIYSQISSQILRGEITAGTQLPPIRTVAADLRISVIPVKQAWEKLDSNGFITTVTGRGTFVAELKRKELASIRDEKSELLVAKFVEECKTLGLDKKQTLRDVSDKWDEK